MTLAVRPLEHVGAEIVGLDASRAIGQELRSPLRDAWLEYGVLVFRRAASSNEEQIRLTECFGEIELHRIESIRVRGEPRLIAVSVKGKPGNPAIRLGGATRVGFLPWHQDLTYTTGIAKGATLRMLARPDSGGETGFIDTAAAYDALDDETKRRIDGLEVRMRFRSGEQLLDVPYGLEHPIELVSRDEIPYTSPVYPDFPDVVHPLVSTHPESGRRSLLVSPWFLVSILGLDRSEAEGLARELVAHVLEPRFRYVHDWDVDDVVLWDNRRSLHCAFGHPPGEVRIAYRATLAGAMQSGRHYEPAARRSPQPTSQ